MEGSSDNKAELIQEVREKLGDKLKSPRRHDDRCISRFLNATSNDVDATIKLMEEWLEWNKKLKPHRQVPETKIEESIKSMKCFYHGYDKKKRPCLIVYPARHFPNQDHEALQRTVAFHLENAIRLMGDGVETFTVLFDFKDFGYSNVDYAGITTGVQLLQKYYPERLGLALLINTPWIFNAVWSVVSGLLNEVTRSKVVFLNTDYKKQLRDYFDEDQLLEDHGGTSTYSFEYPGWPEHALYSPSEYDTDYDEEEAEALEAFVEEKDAEHHKQQQEPAPKPQEKKSSWFGW